MMKASRPTTKVTTAVTRVVLLLLCVLAVLSAVRTLQNSLGRRGASDFHPYWLHGLNLRQGRDPYRASLEGVEPEPPIHFLDGQLITEYPVARPNLGRTLVNTAPLTLLLFTFSLVSWPFARGIWLVANMVLALYVPQLVFKVFPDPQAFTRAERCALTLAFFSLASTRASVWAGQTTLTVFALMLATLLWRNRVTPGLPRAGSLLMAGICLGFALSKYSLALPLLLLLILRLRRGDWLIAGVSIGVQLLGILVVAGLAGVSPAAVVADYVDRFQYMARLSMHGGVQLITSIGLKDDTASLMGAGLLLACTAALGYWWRRRRLCIQLRPMAEYLMLTILILLALLVSYHRVYDVALAVLLVPLGWQAALQRGAWGLSRLQARFVQLGTVGFAAILLLPSETMSVLLSQAHASLWILLVRRAVQSALVIALVASVWLLVRLRQPEYLVLSAEDAAVGRA